MTEFEKKKFMYERGWFGNDNPLAKLGEYVKLGVITAEEYKLITGQDYVVQ